MPREKKKKAGAQEGWTFYGDAVQDAMASDDAVAVGAWLDAGNSADARHEIDPCKCAMPLVAAAAFEGSVQVSMPPSKNAHARLCHNLANGYKSMQPTNCTCLFLGSTFTVRRATLRHMTHSPISSRPKTPQRNCMLTRLTIMSFPSREVDTLSPAAGRETARQQGRGRERVFE